MLKTQVGVALKPILGGIFKTSAIAKIHCVFQINVDSKDNKKLNITGFAIIFFPLQIMFVSGPRGGGGG